MLFKFDENFPEVLRDDLRVSGHDVATCAEEGLAGEGDPVIATHAAAESRILLTCDLDFADIRRYPPQNQTGVVVFRLHRQDIPSCRRALLKLLQSVNESEFSGNLVIVEDSRIRIRRGQDQS